MSDYPRADTSAVVSGRRRRSQRRRATPVPAESVARTYSGISWSPTRREDEVYRTQGPGLEWLATSNALRREAIFHWAGLYQWSADRVPDRIQAPLKELLREHVVLTCSQDPIKLVERMSNLEFERLGSRVVYSNRWMRVREDTFQRPDGSEGTYGIIEKRDYVLVIPYEDGHVWLVEQYRYPVGGRYWEFPQGSWEHSPNANPSDVALGELEEETGLRAGRLELLGFALSGLRVFGSGFLHLPGTGPDVWRAETGCRGSGSRHSPVLHRPIGVDASFWRDS